MTAWIAGLSFISANLGSLEMMGYAAATYQYGILIAHAYWIAAIPAILFLALVMLPFYYICKTHSVPGYLQLRYGTGARSALRGLVRRNDHPHERHQHVLHGCDHEGDSGLEHSFQHLGLFGYGRDLRHGRRAALRDFHGSLAVHADLARMSGHTVAGLIETGAGRFGSPHFGEFSRARLYPHVAHAGIVFWQPDGRSLDRMHLDGVSQFPLATGRPTSWSCSA